MKKIDLDTKKKITADSSSVREAARTYGVSPTTVAKFRKMTNFDEPDTKQANELPEHLRLLLAEVVRLSRYPQRHWIEFLGVLLPKLPTKHAERQNFLKSQMPSKTVQLKALWSEQELYKELRRELGKGKLAKPWPPQKEWAVHRVRVDWRTMEDSGNGEKGKRATADILCLMERFTGMVYLKAYKRLQVNGIKQSILRFRSVCPMPISRLVFVGMSTETKSAKKEKVSRLVSTAIRDLVIKELTKFEEIKYDVEGPLGNAGKIIISLPCSFNDLGHLNQKLMSLANYYNKTKRKDLNGKTWATYIPRERLFKCYKAEKGNAIRRQDFFERTIIKKHADLKKGWD